MTIRLIVGLGNPGAEYELTRHNAGFWLVDQLAHGELKRETRFAALAAKIRISGSEVWLLEPQTFMNRSGQSVGALARFYKIEPEQVLVVHDELDVVPGEAKLKLGGSHAGHNGLRDIHAKLGTDAYWRLRLGIGHPGVKSEVINWVLKKPMAEQRDLIQESIARSVKAADMLIQGEMEKATVQIHTSKPPRPKPPRPEGV